MNQNVGASFGLSVLIVMFFANCEFACPIIVHDLKRLQQALQDQVDFVLVTFDTERDTPDVLHAYRERMKLGTDHWTLLTGKAGDVRELAVLLGVNYQRDARGQFAHSNLITVLNAEGEIIHRQVGLNQDPAETLAAIARLFPAKKAK